ncbi:hypothetical protein ACWOAH_02870 [Vagococcus vulneris]|uniref:Uncharacterized protein n=1 Tax=Vagococcus vulneris TaxID=1977869 RepID=A0A429ZXM1_9ENTE|nr:hypothetical protein [Vagococcus vulneris]RST98618.1 hypothetical protein CBF37_07530 [Vagococcus vulneris]
MKLFKNGYFWLFLAFLILGIYQLLTFFAYINILNFLAGILFIIAAGLVLLAVLKPKKSTTNNDTIDVNIPEKTLVTETTEVITSEEVPQLTDTELEEVKIMLREESEAYIVRWISDQKNISMDTAQEVYEGVLINMEKPF